MIPGLTPDQRHFIQTVFSRLAPPGTVVWVFGSRARGDHRSGSDLDLLVEGGPNGLSSQARWAIEEALEESDLPFRVDLVESANLNPSYQAAVLAERQRLK